MSQATDCIEWFKENKVFPSDKSCLSKCVTLQADMATFMCNLQCEDYCSKKCKTDPYWKNKIKNGRPKNWELSSEKSKDWTKEEIEKLEQILSQLPEQFKSLPLDGIYKMEKSIGIVNPGTTQENSVVLYEHGLANPLFNFDNVIIHELAHVIYNNMNDSEIKDYDKTMGWKELKGIMTRNGEFVKPRAADNPSEDFSYNIEFFLLDQSYLNDKIPTVVKWISKKFSKNFKLKEKCPNEK